MNQEVKAKLNDIFVKSIRQAVQQAVQKVFDNVLATLMSKAEFDKQVSTLSDKLDALTDSVESIRLQMDSKDAAIGDLRKENASLRIIIRNLQCSNDYLLQEQKRENLVLSGFTPSYTETCRRRNHAATHVQ